MSFGKFDLQWITVNGLGDTQFIKALPAGFYALSQGDYSWLAEAVIQDRLGRHSNLAYEMVDNASGASPASRAQIAVEAGACLLGDVINETLFDLGEVVGNPDVGDAFRTELHSEVPVLLIAGEIDGRTPVPNAEEVLKTLPNGQLIQIRGLPMTSPAGCAPPRIVQSARWIFGWGADCANPSRCKFPFRFPGAINIVHQKKKNTKHPTVSM